MTQSRRWKSMSLFGHRFLTGPDTKASRHGLFPQYAASIMLIATSACRLAGLGKKAWRDNDVSKLARKDVIALRATIDKAFDKLLRALPEDGVMPVQAITPDNHATAEATFALYGRLGFLGLAMMEESGELAELLGEIASGRTRYEDNRQAVDHETADVRVYLHVLCESLGINSETSTAAKWAEVERRMPDMLAAIRAEQNKPTPTIDTAAVVAALASLKGPSHASS